jgi:hypothetical protein
MKKSLLIIVSLICIILASKAQFTLQDSLIVHFALDGNASDNSGNGMHGIASATGVYPATNYIGEHGKAMFFNGGIETGIIRLPVGFIDTMSAVTICGWAKPQQFVSGGQGIFGQDNVLEIAFYSGPNRLRVFHTTSGTVDVALNEGANVWYHIAVTADINGMNIYVNGIESLTRSGNFKLSSSAFSTNLGANIISQSSNNYSGSIDDFRIYNRVLSAEEIRILASALSLTYNISVLPTAELCAGQEFDAPFVILGENIADTNIFTLQLSDEKGNFSKPIPIGTIAGTTSGLIEARIPSDVVSGTEYKLRLVSSSPMYIGTVSSQTFTISNPSQGISTIDRGKVLELAFNGNTLDKSNTQRHGAAVGGVSYVDDRHGNPLSAVKLNGTNGHIVLPEGVWFDGSAFSASVWLQPSSYNNWSRIFDFSNGPGSDNVNLSVSEGTTGNIHLGWRQGSNVVCNLSGTKAALNAWTHVAIVYAGAKASIYVNGNLSAQTASVSPPRLLKRQFAYIGRSPWATNAYANAAYDDFILWDRALSHEEIKILANDNGIMSNSPVCAGSSLYLEAPEIEGAEYSWSGPDGFQHTGRVVYIDSAEVRHSGKYTVSIKLGECLFTDSLRDVRVVPFFASAPSFTGLPAYSHLFASNTTLTGLPTGGYFTGKAIDINIFKPALADLGDNMIYYHYYNTQHACLTTAKQKVSIYPNGVIDLGEHISCNGYFYDSGGSSGNYSNNENVIQTFTSASGEMLEFTFSNRSLSANDTLYAFDGVTTNGRILAAYTSGSRWEGFTSTGPSVTFKFVSNESGTNTGWTAMYSCTSVPQQSKNYNIGNGIISLCAGKFYDDGGPSGNHGDVGSYSQTYYSRNGNKIRFDFTQFRTAGGSDVVRFYDGPSTNYPLLTSRANSQGNFSVESTADVLTVTFSMFQNGLTAPGWAADISCTESPLPAINLVDTTIIICNAIIFDHAGPASNYSANRNDTMVLKSSTGNRMQIVFNHNETGIAAGDTLFVFDGESVSHTVIAKFVQHSRLDNIVSTGTSLTLVFKSDGTSQGKGFMGTLSCFDEPEPIVNINLSTGERGVNTAIIRDPGGTGNYSVGTNTTQVFRSLDGNRLQLHFSELAINGNNDGHWLHIFDGPDNTYPRIGSFNQWAWPANSIVHSTGEYLTLNFNSTNTWAGAGAGFTAQISTTSPPLETIPMTKGIFDICEAVISDNGGITANYTANSNDTTTLCSSNGQLLQVMFNHNETNFASGDTLWIFDGESVSFPQLGKYISGSRIETITSTANCLTFVFKSDDTNQARGWQGIVSCVAEPPTMVSYNMSSGERNVCNGTFYDNGGGDWNYARGTWTQTFTSYNQEKLRAALVSFNVNGNNSGHWLTVYDGPNTSSPKIGDYNNFNYPPATFQSSGSSLTFHFNSTNTAAGLSAGWQYNLSCYSGESIDIEWLTSPACAGSGIQIPFTVNETMGEQNVFTAQLSDKDGNFNSPINIGSIKQIGSGVIDAIIPSDIPQGSAYRVRIISSSPATIGAVSPNPIVIFPIPEIPIISATGPLDLCVGVSSVELSLAVQSGVNYRWMKNGNTIIGENTNRLDVSEAGAYSIEIQNTCDTISAINEVIVSVQQPLNPFEIESSRITQICEHEELVLFINNHSNTQYQWFFNAEQIGSGDTSIVAKQAGVYSASATNACGTLFSTNEIEVSIIGKAPEKPKIIASGNTDFCQGGSVPLEIQVQADVIYQWERNGEITGTEAHSLLAIESGLYAIKVSNQCGLEISEAIEITVNKLPETPAIITDGELSFCYRGSVGLSVQPQLGAEYQWKRGEEDIYSGAAEYTATVSGLYSVVVSNSCGQAFSDTIEIVVFDNPIIPVIEFDGAASICPSESIVLNTSPIIGHTIQWYKDDVEIEGAIGLDIEINTAGTYKVSIKNKEMCSNVSEPITINQLPAPGVEIVSNSNALCPGLESLTISTDEDPSASFKWYNGNILIDSETNHLNIGSEGLYWVVKTYLNGCSVKSNEIEITEAEAPEAIIEQSETQFCEGSSVLLIAKQYSDAEYTWYINGQILKGPSANNLAEVFQSGSYTVRVINNYGCESISETSDIEMHPAPNAEIQAGSTSICQGSSSVTLSANIVDGAIYEWFRNGLSLGAATVGQHEYSTSENGNYSVKIQKECISTSAPLTIEESLLPGNAGAISGNTTFCAGSTITLSIPGVSYASGYIWDIYPINGASIVSGQGSRSIVINTRDQNITISVTPFNECGAGKLSTKQFAVDNSIFCTGISILYSAYPTNSSIGTPVVFTNHTSSMLYPDASPRWNFGAGANPATANGNGPHSVTYSSPGSKTVTIEYVSNFGGFVIASETKTSYIIIPEKEVFTSDISGNESLTMCYDTELYSVLPSLGSIYFWQVPETASIISGQGTHSILVSFGGTGGSIYVTETTSSSSTGQTKEITVQCSAGTINDTYIEIKNSCSVYPNPVDDVLYLINHGYAPVSYQIKDMNGSKLYTGTLWEIETLDFSIFPSGLYAAFFGNNTLVLFIKK